MAKAPPLQDKYQMPKECWFHMTLPCDMDAGKRTEKPENDEYLGHFELLR